MVAVAIIGSGPAALTLGYVLSGHVPIYNPEAAAGPHPDNYLHSLLLKHETILDACLDVEVLEYVAAAPRFSSFFSKTTLPVNLLLDTLRFSDETETSLLADEIKSRIRWVRTPALAEFLIIGDSVGGQWSDNTTDDPDSRAISYLEMLSLPGYSFTEFLATHGSEEPYACMRPTRTQVAAYYSDYALRFALPVMRDTVTRITRRDPIKSAETAIGYLVETLAHQAVSASDIVLATGVNGHGATAYNVVPPAAPTDRIVVVGSGLGAADAILSAWAQQRHVLHVFKSDIKILKRYPASLYPEYARVWDAMLRRHAHNYDAVDCPDPNLEQRYRLGRRGSLLYAKEILPPHLELAAVTRDWLVNKFPNSPGEACDSSSNSSSDFCASGHGTSIAGRAPGLSNVWTLGSLSGDVTVRYLIGDACAVAAALLHVLRTGDAWPALVRPGPDRARATPDASTPCIPETSNLRRAPPQAPHVSPSRGC